MRFDGNVFYHLLERYPPDLLMEEWREEASLFDQAGFTTIWIGEQHFWIAAPNPVLINTHLATHTKRLRVGQSACVLPDWHPIRLAEDLALLDNMTRGRLDVGIARGVNTLAGITFNADADRRDQARNYALFSETLDVLIKAWTEDAFVHQGRFYNFPPTGWKEQGPRIYSDDPAHYTPDGEIIALPVRPKPYQKPHPPIWQAADSTASYAFAAERGHATTCLSRSFEGVREAWTTYKETASRVWGRDVPMGRSADGKTLNVMRTCYVAETQEQAEREAREGINRWYDVTTGLNPSRGKQSCVASWEELKDRDLNAEWFDFLQEKEIIWVGSPEYVAERIDRLRTELNCAHVTLWPNPVGLPYKKVMHSLELFAERVIPMVESRESVPAASQSSY